MGHLSHLSLASLLANVPGEQGMQETEPVLLVYVPFGQGVRGAFLPAQVYPRWQTLCSPFKVDDPGGTALQLVEPFKVLPHPLGQLRHVVLPGEF